MFPTRFLTLNVLLCGMTTAVAEPLKAGSDIDVALRGMSTHEYQTTMTQSRVADPRNDHMEWEVDGGVLSAVYSIQSRKVIGLGYRFPVDGDSKLETLRFRFSVVQFDPATGSMVIQTSKNKNGEQGGAGQPSTASQDKTNSGALSELEKAITHQAAKVEQRKKVLDEIVKTKNLVGNGSGAAKHKVAEPSTAEAISAALEAQDYLDAKREFETDQELLRQMKLKLESAKEKN